MNNGLPLRPAPDVPVFVCLAILARTGESGQLTARDARLAGVEAQGNSEREVLTALLKRFKEVVVDYVSRNAEIPFREPPDEPGADEFLRRIPVHL